MSVRTGSVRALVALVAGALVLAGTPAVAEPRPAPPAADDGGFHAPTPAERQAVLARPAAGTASLAGRVAIPSGTPSDTALYLDAYTYDTRAKRWELAAFDEIDASGDGSFRVEGLAGGKEHRLALHVYSPTLVGGFWAGKDATLVAIPELGAPLLPPRSGLLIAPARASTLTVEVTVPQGFSWARGGFSVIAYELTPDEGTWVSQATQTVTESRRTVTFAGMRPGVPYLLAAADSAARFGTGYYHAKVGGLVSAFADASPVPAGSAVAMRITQNPVAPRLSNVTRPAVRGAVAVGARLTADPGVWSLTGLSLTYQWLREGKAIKGATARTYTPVAGDRGKRLAVKVTASRAGVGAVSATSAQTRTVAKGAAPRATKRPAVTGTRRLGAVLRATKGRWDVKGVTLTYRWLRDGRPIKGATAKKYRVRKADVGRRISVRVTARAAGHAKGTAVSAAKKVYRGKPRLTVALGKARHDGRSELRVRVRNVGLARPTGTVRVTVAGTATRATMRKSAKGRVSVLVPRLSRGKHTVKVRYTPAKASAKYVRTVTKKLTVRVR